MSVLVVGARGFSVSSVWIGVLALALGCGWCTMRAMRTAVLFILPLLVACDEGGILEVRSGDTSSTDVGDTGVSSCTNEILTLLPGDGDALDAPFRVDFARRESPIPSLRLRQGGQDIPGEARWLGDDGATLVFDALSQVRAEIPVARTIVWSCGTNEDEVTLDAVSWTLPLREGVPVSVGDGIDIRQYIDSVRVQTVGLSNERIRMRLGAGEGEAIDPCATTAEGDARRLSSGFVDVALSPSEVGYVRLRGELIAWHSLAVSTTIDGLLREVDTFAVRGLLPAAAVAARYDLSVDAFCDQLNGGCTVRSGARMAPVEVDDVPGLLAAPFGPRTAADVQADPDCATD